MRFTSVMFWELVQNTPVIVFFVASVWFWAHHSRAKALGCALAGGLAAGGVIYLTEFVKIGYREPVSTMLANMVGVSLLQILIVPYVGAQARWSNWKTDVLVAGVAGPLQSAAQYLAARDLPIIIPMVHAVALALAAFLILGAVRPLKDKTLPAALARSLVIAVIMTLAIGLLEYTPFLITG